MNNKNEITIMFAEFKELVQGFGVNNYIVVNPRYGVSLDTVKHQFNCQLIFMCGEKTYGMDYALNAKGELVSVDGVNDLASILTYVEEDDLQFAWSLKAKEMIFTPVIRYQFVEKSEAKDLTKLRKEAKEALELYDCIELGLTV